MSQTARDLKDEGNVALRKNNPYLAFNLYTQALQHATTLEQRRTIHLNRAEVSLRLGFYDQALQDAESDQESLGDEKGLYRAARARYELRNFPECHRTLASLLTAFPQSVAGKILQARVEARLKEERHGKYDFKAMYMAAQESPYLDHATYMGPVAVRQSAIHGRGLITTRDVVAGELLICEKAFTYFWDDGKDVATADSDAEGTPDESPDRKAGAYLEELGDITMDELQQNPSRLHTFNLLYSGDFSNDGMNLDASPTINESRLKHQIALNAFGSTPSTRATYFSNLTSSTPPPPNRTCGTFINAAYVNHSCAANARCSFIGDMIIVRAARDIPGNTEITHWYHVHDPGLNHEEMQEKFQGWGFVCGCEICEQSNSTPREIMKKGEGILDKLNDLFAHLSTTSKGNIAKAESLLASLESLHTLPASKFPHLALWNPYCNLIALYALSDDPMQVALTTLKALGSLGFVFKMDISRGLEEGFEIMKWGQVRDGVPEAFVHLWIAYAKIEPERCRRCEVYAKTTYKICVGEDETFYESYGIFLSGDTERAIEIVRGRSMLEAFQGFSCTD